MATIDDLIQLEISDEMLHDAVEHALQMSFLDNLRDRSPFVQFDSKIRGYLGEKAIENLFNENGISIVSIDKSEGQLSEDIDMSVANDYVNDIRIEIKTSMITELIL